MEIVNDLMAVQTVLPIGKTAKLYNTIGDIADDVSVSLDGQAPYSFDHTDYGSDGDPVLIWCLILRRLKPVSSINAA